MLVILLITYSCLMRTSMAAPDNKGTNFLIAFGGNFPADEDLVLFIGSSTSEQNNMATISYYENGTSVNNRTVQQITIATGSVQQVTIPAALRLTNEPGVSIEEKTIEVVTSYEVSLYGVNRAYFSGEAFMVLPTDVWGTTYFVFSAPDVMENNNFRVESGSQFTVIAEENTDVVITFPVNASRLYVEYNGSSYTGGDILNISLLAMESLQVSANQDLTGTRIDSSSRVGVLCGHRRTGVVVPEGSDHLEEMIPPINTWGREFIVPAIVYRTSHDLIRVIAAEDGSTTVNFYFSSNFSIELSGPGDFIEVTLTSDKHYYINGSKAIGVMQYCASNDLDFAGTDPFMTWITPLEQFGFDYTIATAESAVSEAYFQTLVIIYKHSQLSGLTINGLNITETDCSFFPSKPHCAEAVDVLGNSEYSYATYAMNEDFGTYVISHVDPLATFGILVYGQIEKEAYGYTGGSRFATLGSFCVSTSVSINDGLDNDCDARIDEELVNGVDDDGDGLIDEDTVGIDVSTTATTSTPTTTLTPTPTTNPTSTPTATFTSTPTTTMPTTPITTTTTITTTTITPSTTITPTASETLTSPVSLSSSSTAPTTSKPSAGTSSSTTTAPATLTTSSVAPTTRVSTLRSSTTVTNTAPSTSATATTQTRTTDGSTSGTSTASNSSLSQETTATASHSAATTGKISAFTNDTAPTTTTFGSTSTVSSTSGTSGPIPEEEAQKKLNAALIAGITVPVLSLLILAAVGVTCCCLLAAKRKKRNPDEEEEVGPDQPTASTGDAENSEEKANSDGPDDCSKPEEHGAVVDPGSVPNHHLNAANVKEMTKVEVNLDGVANAW